MTTHLDHDDRSGFRWRTLPWVALPGVLLASALLAAHAIAGVGPTSWAAARFGHAWGGHGDETRREGHEAAEHARFAADWALRGVGASDAQREQLDGALESAIGDLQTLASAHRAHREALLALWAQDEVDAVALENLRAEELALADRASQRLADVVLEAASVLDAEQRRELLDAFEHFHGHRGGPHRSDWGRGH